MVGQQGKNGLSLPHFCWPEGLRFKMARPFQTVSPGSLASSGIIEKARPFGVKPPKKISSGTMENTTSWATAAIAPGSLAGASLEH
jgi:hypothetical protein